VVTMEFPFDINLLLGEDVSVIDRTLKPFSNNPTNLRFVLFKYDCQCANQWR